MAYVYDPRTGYYNENYQEKPTGLQQAQTDKTKAEATRTQSAIPIDEQRAMSEEQLQAAQSEAQKGQAAKARADAWRAANVLGKGETTDAGGYYAKGGPVVNVGYKHSNNPMYAKYGSTMDSSLLAKNRNR